MDDEFLQKVNARTGEVIDVENKVRPNNIPDGKERFMADEMFTKNYIKSWEYLVDVLKPIELKIALKMANMTEMNTNSLSPLDSETSLSNLAEFFGISRTKAHDAFKTLFKHGVYATFEYSHYRRGKVKEWVFNPYISFKGKLINSDLKNLFDNTVVAKVFKY